MTLMEAVEQASDIPLLFEVLPCSGIRGLQKSEPK